MKCSSKESLLGVEILCKGWAGVKIVNKEMITFVEQPCFSHQFLHHVIRVPKFRTWLWTFLPTIYHVWSGNPVAESVSEKSFTPHLWWCLFRMYCISSVRFFIAIKLSSMEIKQSGMKYRLEASFRLFKSKQNLRKGLYLSEFRLASSLSLSWQWKNFLVLTGTPFLT